MKHEVVKGTMNETVQVQWEKAFTNCFQKVDDEVGGKAIDPSSEPVAPETVGSTAVVALICSSHIIVANCGDSRAVLYRGKEPIALSNDHKVITVSFHALFREIDKNANSSNSFHSIATTKIRILYVESGYLHKDSTFLLLIIIIIILAENQFRLRICYYYYWVRKWLKSETTINFGYLCKFPHFNTFGVL